MREEKFEGRVAIAENTGSRAINNKKGGLLKEKTQ